MFPVWNLAASALLLGGMLALQSYGRRLAVRVDATDSVQDARTAQGAVFALLGLLLAFTFSGALQRFDERRTLVMEEANAIGTAWFRIDLLPTARQPVVRDLFRQYLDVRIEMFRDVSDTAARAASMAKVSQLQRQIWDAVVTSVDAKNEPPPFNVLAPALNNMFDITTIREAVTLVHPPMVIYGMIAALSFIGAIFSGYALAGGHSKSWVHRLAFPLVTALTLFVIIDIEYPRLGFIRMDAVDYLMTDLRKSMN